MTPLELHDNIRSTMASYSDDPYLELTRFLKARYATIERANRLGLTDFMIFEQLEEEHHGTE